LEAIDFVVEGEEPVGHDFMWIGESVASLDGIVVMKLGVGIPNRKEYDECREWQEYV
jgi:hypothetical protein